MQLNPAEISELLKSKIQNLEVSADSRNQGTVISVTDGICRIHGLSNVMQGEMIEFPGNVYGLALNLERDSVGAVILGEYESISEGDVVKTTGHILKVPVGPELIGRVVNTLGQPIDGKGPINTKETDVIVPAPQTMFAGIRKLPAGHLALFEYGQLALRQYWDLSFAGGYALPAGRFAALCRRRHCGRGQHEHSSYLQCR